MGWYLLTRSSFVSETLINQAFSTSSPPKNIGITVSMTTLNFWVFAIFTPNYFK